MTGFERIHRLRGWRPMRRRRGPCRDHDRLQELDRFRGRPVPPTRTAATVAGMFLALALAAGCGGDASPAAPTPPPPAGPPPVAVSGPWAAELSAFDAQDRAAPYRRGGVVFVGSSSIRFWDLDASFPGRDYLNRGFGGSQIADSVEYLELLVLRHEPRAVVLYAGDNDVAAGKTPAAVAADFDAFARGLHAALPSAHLLFLAIKPSVARWNLVERMREANRLIRERVDADSRMTWVDVHAPMIGADGLPRRGLLAADGLHLSAAGYALWTRLLLPHLPG